MATLPPIQRTLRCGTPLTIRSAAREDSAAILDFRRRTCATTDQVLTQAHECPATAEEQWESMRSTIERPDAMFLVGLIAGEVVCLVSFAAGVRERARHAGVMGITTALEWRGRGVGTAALRVLIDWCAAHPTIEKVGLVVFSSNPDAYRLYERLGFVEEGRQFGQTQIRPGEYVDDIHMARWVKPRRSAGGPA